jgi:hypothetical protein
LQATLTRTIGATIAIGSGISRTITPVTIALRATLSLAVYASPHYHASNHLSNQHVHTDSDASHDSTARHGQPYYHSRHRRPESDASTDSHTGYGSSAQHADTDRQRNHQHRSVHSSANCTNCRRAQRDTGTSGCRYAGAQTGQYRSNSAC